MRIFPFSYRIIVRYPTSGEEISLRTDENWAADLAPRTAREGSCFEFEIISPRPFFYFKPVLSRGGRLLWSRGANYLALADSAPREVYPYFEDDDACTVCELREAGSGRQAIRYRVFHPPGYAENTLKKYPVIYMNDGQNLFFPREATFGHDWKIAETLRLLEAMNAVDKLLVVGVYPLERETDYTLPGYVEHARGLVEVLKPRIDQEFRSLRQPETTAILGSSLGAVAALHAAWQWPNVFGMAGCLSGTFGFKDDLRRRIASQKKRNLKIYLDSGWPDDNYEITRDMASLLVSLGFDQGGDLLYFAFPGEHHEEAYWAMRLHLPLQFFFGRLRKHEAIQRRARARGKKRAGWTT